ncbi:MAG: amidohydrolase family protein [Chloroflexi bacterium]|nr:amidohydrolase family protein [Chloroflexota bacterium]
MNGDLLLTNIRLPDGTPSDLLVRGGVIRELRPGLAAADLTAIDGGNQLVLPGLVNAHAHIDKNLLGRPWLPNQVPLTRTIVDYSSTERRLRRELNLDAREQAAQFLRAALETGTTHVRTHVDIDTDAGLKHWEAVLAARDAFRDVMTVQTVAFPQSGMLVRPGTVELLEAAVRSGADAIGGLDPSTVDRDPVRHLDTVFGIANRFGVEADIHVHEPGMLGAFAVELIVERTKALGMQGRVTLSHGFCLGQIDEAYLLRLIDMLLEARITVMSLGSGPSAFPPLLRLHAAGVPLCTGTDGVRDSWGPNNKVDILNRLHLLSWRINARRDEEIETLLDIATYGGAARMSDSDYGLAAGRQADFIVVPGDTPAQVVVDQPPRALVVKRGRIVARDGRLTLPAGFGSE